MHKAMVVYPVTPPVVRCACGARVVIRREGMLREHLATGAHGEFFPWDDSGEED